MLGREGVRAIVLEAGPEVGAAWRTRYDRLHLHTPRLLSGLPGYRIPRELGRWLERDAVLRYLQDYAAAHSLDVRVGTRVERIESDGDGWLLQTSAGRIRAEEAVVATGFSSVPRLPDWPGGESFRGELLH